MVEFCGFVKGKGLSHEECMKSGHTVVAPKIEEKPDFTCSKCGSHRIGKAEEFNANCFAERVAGKEPECDWKTISLWCADCGARQENSDDSGGKEAFSVTSEMMKKLKEL